MVTLIKGNTLYYIVDFIEKMSELKVLIDKLSAKYPEFSELVPLINDLMFRCMSMISTIIEIYSLADSTTRSLIFNNAEVRLTDLNSSIIKKFINIINDTDDLEDALSRVSVNERGLLIDTLKILRKRGLLDFDIDYDDKLRVKIIRKPEEVVNNPQ